MGDEDGRVGGHGAHLFPQAHKKYIDIWNNSQGKVTGNWYKDLHTTETERKIQLAVQDRKRNDWVGTYACAWELRGKERSQGQTFVLGVSGLNHRPGVPVPVWGDASPRGYCENCENRQKGWRSPEATHEGWAGTCAGWREVCASSCHCAVLLSPSRENTQSH